MRKWLLGLGLMLIAGCSSSTDAGLSENNADVVGTISQIAVAADGSGQTRLAVTNLKRGPNGTTGTLFLIVDPTTHITLGGGQAGNASDLKVGIAIFANVDPNVVDTFPPEYFVTELRIPPAA